MDRAQLEQLALEKMSSLQPSNGNPSREQLEQMAMEKIALQNEPQSEVPQVNQNREADLGFINRARYAIEPLESNRRALLMQEYGEGNVQQDDKGNLYVKQGNQFRPVNKEGFSVADVADFAGATPEMAGGVVGTVAGAIGGGGVASIPAAIGLGATGGAVGSAARQGLSALLGTPQVATPTERATELGLSATIGGITGGAGQGLKAAAPAIKKGAGYVGDKFSRGVIKVPGAQTTQEVLETTSKATKGVIDSLGKTFSVKRADDADELLKIADEFGIDKSILPEAVEYGDKSLVSRLGRVVAEGPAGEQRLQNFSKAQIQVSNAVDDSISKLSPYRPTSEAEAGQFLVDSVNEASKNFFNNLDATYSSVVDNAPGAVLDKRSQQAISSKLLGLERFARGRVERGIGSQKQEAKSILEAVSQLKNSNGSLKQTVEALRNIGEEAFKKGGQNRLPIDKARLQNLYFDLQKEVINTVRKSYGNKVADDLVTNNKMISDFLGESSVLSKVIGKESIAPENIYKSLIKNSDTRKIEALTAIMPPEKVQSLKSSLLDSMIVRNEDGLILHERTINNLKKNKDVVAKLFRPEELQEVGKLLKLGRRMGNPVMSTSGTGASNAFNDFINKAKEAVINENIVEIAKKRGASPPRSPSNGSKFKRTIPVRPDTVGSFGNVILDNPQRGGAYFTRGPAGERKEKKR